MHSSGLILIFCTGRNLCKNHEGTSKRAIENTLKFLNVFYACYLYNFNCHLICGRGLCWWSKQLEKKSGDKKIDIQMIPEVV